VVTSDIISKLNEIFNERVFEKYFVGTYEPPLGVEIKYSHSPLTEDGNLVLNFTIIETDSNVTKISSKSVYITGIDQANAKRYLESLPSKNYLDVNNFPQPLNSHVLLDSNNVDNFFTFSNDESYQSPKNVSITYYVSKIENYQFTVTFTIRKNDSSSTQPITITKTYYMGDRDVNNAYDYLKQLSTQPLQISSALTEYLESNKQDFDNIGNAHVFASYTLPSNNVTIKYTHPAIDEDGELVFTFYIEKGDITRSLIKNVIVRGINVEQAKSLLENLETDEIEHTSDIEAVPSWKYITNDLFTNIIKKDKPNFPSNIAVKYKIPHALIEDGELTVQFKVKRKKASIWTQVNDYTVSVTGISLPKTKKILEDLKNYDYSEIGLEPPNPTGLYKTFIHRTPIYAIDWTEVNDEFFTNILSRSAPKLPSNVYIEYKILESIVDGSGELKINFRIKLKNSNQSWIQIDDNKWNVTLVDKRLDIKKQLEDLSSETPVQHAEAIGKVSSWTDVTNDLFTNIIKQQKPSWPSKIKVQYQIPREIVEDGPLTINFRIEDTNYANDDDKYVYANVIISIAGFDSFEITKTQLKNIPKDLLEFPVPIIAQKDWIDITPELFNDILLQEKPMFPSTIQIQYQIPTMVSESDTSLTVKFRIKRDTDSDWTEVDDYVVQAKYVNLVETTKNMLQNLSGKKVTVYETLIPKTDWSSVTDELFSKILLFDKPDFPSFVVVEYEIPTELTEDGTLVINFRIRNKTSDIWEYYNNFNLQIQGILASIVYEYLTTKLVQKEFSVFPYEDTGAALNQKFNDEVASQLFEDPDGEDIQLPNSVDLVFGVIERNIPDFSTTWLFRLYINDFSDQTNWKKNFVFQKKET